MSNSPIRVGFLGTGFIATYHSKSLRQAGASIIRAGAFDIDTARRDAFCTASGHQPLDSEEQVIDSADAVYICAWTSEHLRLVEQVVHAGKAVFVEKPLATTLATARELTNTIVKSGVVNQVGLVLRHSPAYLLARELVVDRSAGRVMNVVFRDDQFIPIQGYYSSTWRSDVTRAGAGTLLEHSIHDIDMLRFVVGDVTAVSARSTNFHGYPGIEDSVSVALQFENGALGTLASIWHDNLTRPSQRRVEIFCENRTISITGHDWYGPIEWHDADGSSGRLEGDELVSRTAALSYIDANPDVAFIRAVNDTLPAYPDVTIALRAHEIVNAIYHSAEQDGKSVATND